MIHHVKTIEPFYSHVKQGIKTFELRKNDRDYFEKDLIELMQFVDGKLTGQSVYVEIAYMLEDFPGIEKGYCILGINRLSSADPCTGTCSTCGGLLRDGYVFCPYCGEFAKE